mgnify:CR=1 FL=1
MAIDVGRIEAAVAEILLAIGENPARPGLLETPRRVAELYSELFAGVGLGGRLDGVIEGESGEFVLVRDIQFRSICEHHLLPFLGVAHVAYAPDGHIVGLGHIAELVTTLASRPQLQERLTDEVADAITNALAPRGVLVVLDASHGCVSARGPRQTKSSTVTIATRGSLGDPAARAEVMALIGGAA